MMKKILSAKHLVHPADLLSLIMIAVFLAFLMDMIPIKVTAQTPVAVPGDFTVTTNFGSSALVPNQIINATVTAKNISTEPFDGTVDVLVIVALYSPNNTMISISYISKGIFYQGTETLSAGFKLPSDVSNCKVKSFMWDGKDIEASNMIPISNEVQIPEATVATPVSSTSPDMTPSSSVMSALTPTASVTPSAIPVPTPPVLIEGSFIQPYLSGSWSLSNFNIEYSYMINAKVKDHIIWQWTADSKTKTAYYPTKLPGWRQCNSGDPVMDSLQSAKAKGIQVWLGLNNSDDWWNNYANNDAWLTNEFAVAKTIAKELWDRYGSLYKDQIAGFYLSLEVDNVNFQSTTAQDRIKKAYKNITDYIHENMNKPVMISPFFNEKAGQTPTQYAAMWKNILQAAPIDIIALQDGVGAGHCSISTIGKWLSELKNAINEVRPSTSLWSNLETFGPNNTAAPISKVIDQINAQKKYVKKFTSFSFNHYNSPQQGYMNEYNQYKAYANK